MLVAYREKLINVGIFSSAGIEVCLPCSPHCCQGYSIPTTVRKVYLRVSECLATIFCAREVKILNSRLCCGGKLSMTVTLLLC